MVKFRNSNGEVKTLNKVQFRKLMQILKNRAKLQKQEKFVAEMYQKWQ